MINADREVLAEREIEHLNNRSKLTKNFCFKSV